MKINQNAKDFVSALLAIQLEQHRAIDNLNQCGICLDSVKGLYVNLLDPIADLYGVPKDNTVETHACERANKSGEWPEDAYCRDWILEDWQQVEDGDATIDDFLRVLEEGAADIRIPHA